MSLAKAVKAKCIDCIYDSLAGGTHLAQVEACTSEACPLWPYRPVTETTRKARTAEALNQLPPEQQAIEREKRRAQGERLKKLRELSEAL